MKKPQVSNTYMIVTDAIVIVLVLLIENVLSVL